MIFSDPRQSLVRRVLGLLLFTALGFLTIGYHPGAEDDSVYLTAVKSDLNPALYPHDSDFFKLQLKATVFDSCMSEFVRVTGMPVAWSELFWQYFSLFLIVAASWTIVCRLFDDTAARWGGIALLTAMFSLPVAGTALYIADQYLHPRSIATGLILFGISEIIKGKQWKAVPLLALAFAFHPMMGALGISFCCILTLSLSKQVQVQLRAIRDRLAPDAATTAPAVIPLGWLFDPPSKQWLAAIDSRHWFRLYQWEWYEWLGAIAPIALFWCVSKYANRFGNPLLARFSIGVFLYAAFQQSVAMLILGPRSLITLSALEPMRYLHLVYIFLVLVSGGYLGRHVLRSHAWRWIVFLVVANGGMCYAQRQLFPSTDHLEFPGATPRNPWLQAFDWIRKNTPRDAYFAVDPYYMALPGEEYHSFRALAERSVLADAIKDTSIITKVPSLGSEWERQVTAQDGWEHFRLQDYERLKDEFGVTWVLVRYPQPTGLPCAWHNQVLAACQVP